MPRPGQLPRPRPQLAAGWVCGRCPWARGAGGGWPRVPPAAGAPAALGEVGRAPASCSPQAFIACLGVLLGPPFRLCSSPLFQTKSKNRTGLWAEFRGRCRYKSLNTSGEGGVGRALVSLSLAWWWRGRLCVDQLLLVFIPFWGEKK